MICFGKKYQNGIGGKAEGLFWLQEIGLQVPEFLVIPYDNFKDFTPSENEKWNSEAVRKKFLEYRLPDDDRERLIQILDTWDFPKNAVVVRSSVLDEDGDKNAFPGVMDSFLNITSMEDMEEAVAKCAASAWSTNAEAYRRQHNLDLLAKPAVIIQQQIEPDASGVIFTTFPQYPQEMAIHAVLGFGEALMNGTAEADEFYFDKNKGKLHRQRITSKTTAFIKSEKSGLKATSVELNLQDRPGLSNEELQEIFEKAQAAERKAGRALDIEFAVQHGKLFFLQARPITQEIPEVVVYDNSNIQESYCGVTTPLTFSFASRAYKTVYSQTMQVLGISTEVIKQHDNVVSNLLGLVKGRIFYNINNWYRGLQLLPSFKQNKADMEMMMGLQEPVDFVEDVEKPFGQKLKLLPKLLLNYYRLWRKFQKLHKHVPLFQQNFKQHYSDFYNEKIQNLNASEFLQKKKHLDEKLLNNWVVPIINDFNVMMINGSVLRNLKNAGIRSPEEFLGRFFSGDQEIESTQPTSEMLKLAHKAAQFSELKKLIIELPQDLHEKVRDLQPQFHLEVETFIHQYGDRTVGELKLETNTMRVQPLIFYKYLRNFLIAEKLPEINMKSVSAKARKELDLTLIRKSFLFKRKMRKQLDKLKKGIQYRESMRLERTRLFGMYRSIYRAHAEFLVQNNLIDKVEDVFYLTEEELENILELPDPKKLVRERQTEFSRYKQVEVPSRVTVPSPPLMQESTQEEPGVLRGQGCYPGKISGEVVVIMDPGDDLDVNGKIICALRTDPGWAALFPTCKAVLIEKGSSLSHSVILLRELGIPGIINIPGLTRRMKNGDQISIDGESGEIFMENERTNVNEI